MTAKPPNVIVFGETGAGKSSVINMLDGGGTALVSDRAKGVTFSSEFYQKNIRGKTFNIYDTVGLNEGSAGTVTAQDAIQNLYNLIHQLDAGISLLLYVMRAPRIKATAKKNYELFYETFCDSKVPIGIIVTGLEERDNMDGWWEENQTAFQDYKMTFEGHACVTATRGKKRGNSYSYQDEYQESKNKVEELILRWTGVEPYTLTPQSLFSKIYDFLAAFLHLPVEPVGDHALYAALQSHAGLSKSEAREKVYAK